MKTKTLLPLVETIWYLHEKRYSRTFGRIGQSLHDTIQAARQWMQSREIEHYNLYTIDKVNGTWRTDWELSPDGVELPHPWA